MHVKPVTLKSVILNLLSFPLVFKREALQTFICTPGKEKMNEKKKKDSPARPKEKPVKENSKIKQHNFES